MLVKKYNSIMERDAAHRNKWAFGLATALSVFILVGFGFYKGYLSFENTNAVVAKSEKSNQTATVITAGKAPTPITNSKETIGGIFDEIKNQYSQFIESINSVLVPFVTGIEVYERE